MVRPGLLERERREAEVRREAGRLHRNPTAALHGNSVAAPADPITMNALVNEILSLRQAQEECANENVALRARLMTAMSQHSQVEEEFNTPDRGEFDSVRGKIEHELGEPDGH